jgi:hypothetical protein
MKNILGRIAAVLSFIIGLMAVIAGGQVLLGHLPDYYVIGWLPVYNFIVGIISASLTAILIWKAHRHALPLAVATFSLHALVMIVLQTAYRGVVAPDSLRAMTVRMVIWVVISGLLVARRQVKDPSGHSMPGKKD